MKRFIKRIQRIFIDKKTANYPLRKVKRLKEDVSNLYIKSKLYVYQAKKEEKLLREKIFK